MNLKRWSKLTGILPTHPTTERRAVSLIYDDKSPHHWLLWRLTDYVVSSVSGPVVWLVPRTRKAWWQT